MGRRDGRQMQSEPPNQFPSSPTFAPLRETIIGFPSPLSIAHFGNGQRDHNSEHFSSTAAFW